MSALRPIIHVLSLSLPLMILTGCGDGKEAAPENTTAAATGENAQASALETHAAAFDPLTASVTDKELGAFPYVTPPQGFTLSENSELELERKFLFPSGALRVTEGRYYHARIYAADGAAWGETLLMHRLDEQVLTLGGVRVFDGAMPENVRERAQAEQPRSISDLYDPWPYRFRQYLIRTPHSLVWVEAGYGYNAEMLDLTVVEEPLPESPRSGASSPGAQ